MPTANISLYGIDYEDSFYPPLQDIVGRSDYVYYKNSIKKIEKKPFDPFWQVFFTRSRLGRFP